MPSRHACRICRIAGAVLAILLPMAGSAQSPDAAADSVANASSRAPAGTDPVIGSVDGKLIYLSDLARAVNTLPEQIQNMPFDSVMPVVLDRLIDHAALTMSARQAGLDRQPDIRREMQAAADRVLESAWLAKVTSGKVTDAAIQARFNQEYANRPATDEVRARHILVGSEAEAKSVLAELQGGANFATVARAVSKDADARQGGDLGFFRRDQVWPGFADVAFSLQPGQISPAPIHNEFGWHIVKVEERRLVAPPTLSEVRDKIRQELTTEIVHEAIADARSRLIIHKFNLDGSAIDADPQTIHSGR